VNVTKPPLIVLGTPMSEIAVTPDASPVPSPAGGGPEIERLAGDVEWVIERLLFEPS
jgi:hypothetical protein